MCVLGSLGKEAAMHELSEQEGEWQGGGDRHNMEGVFHCKDYGF